MSAPPLGFDPSSSWDRFLQGADEFFDRPGGHRLARDGGRARSSTSPTCWPAPAPGRTCCAPPTRRARSPTPRSPPSYLAGAGLNSFIPARVGDAVKIFLAKKSIRRSSYPAITSSFFVQSVFDTTAGILVFVFALTQGLLPAAPELPEPARLRDLLLGREPGPADLLRHRARDRGSWSLFAVLARRAEEFWERVKQGVVILTDVPRYLREVASGRGSAG